MKRYRVVAGVLSVGAGTRLSIPAGMARPRAHHLEGEGGDLYVARSTLHFIVGEELALAEVHAWQLHQVEEIGEPPPAAPTERPGRARRIRR